MNFENTQTFTPEQIGELKHNIINITNPLLTGINNLTDRLDTLIDLDNTTISERPNSRSIRKALQDQQRDLKAIQDYLYQLIVTKQLSNMNNLAKQIIDNSGYDFNYPIEESHIIGLLNIMKDAVIKELQKE